MKNHSRLRQRAYAACAILVSIVFSTHLSGQRLPTTVIPDHYQLLIDANIADRKFSGEETIHVRVSQPVTTIVLNSLGLEIGLAEVNSGGASQAAKVAYDKSAETVQLTFERTIPSGEADLHLKFGAPLTESLRGLYLSKSPRRYYAVTQFEGTYARMMFPSFDEPAFKATFDLTTIADQGDTAISNGKIIADVPVTGTNRHRITFGTSPKMSTYLLALAIGDWGCLERTAGGVPLRVCSVPEKKASARFALEAAAHAVEFYNRWYGIKYPFGKLDMVAIPDYEWGGMENTASIFYNENSLLLEEDKASVSAQRGHATVVAHEIAHQWFGDLVTAAWWDDIWLNEGFATWMERKPVAAWHPEWHMEKDEAASAQAIIRLDSLASARAIHGDPRTSAEIKEMFDGFSYEKGGAVLRMLEAYVGPEVFRNGVNQYLKEHANGNAKAEDFWQTMARVSHKPVDQIMPGFVMQAGVPLLTMHTACHNGHMQIDFQQERFFASPHPASGDPASGTPASGTLASPNHPDSVEQIWRIPVYLETPDKGRSIGLEVDKKDQKGFGIDVCPPWVFANRDADGYYRVQYEPAMLKKLASVAEKELNTPERIALVEDTWAMVRAGRYPIGDFLDLAKELRAEHESVVVNLLSNHLSEANPLAPKAEADQYAAFTGAQFTPLANELGWVARSSDTDDQKIMRASLMQVLGDAGDPQALAAAKEIVQRYLKKPGSTEGTLTEAAFAVAARHGDATLYESLYQAWNTAQSTDDYNLYLYSLAGFRQPELMQKTLELVTQGKLRQQTYPGFFAALLVNPASQPAAWAYLKSHWDDLAEKVTSFGGRGAVTALGSFCTPQQRDDVKQFFATHKAPGAQRAVQQSLERMNGCIEFKEVQGRNMEKWLAGR